MNLSKLTTEQILNRYQLPPRFLVYYTSQVAKDALSNVEKPDIRSLKAVEVAERFGNGESFTPEYLDKVSEDAYAAYAAPTTSTPTPRMTSTPPPPPPPTPSPPPPPSTSPTPRRRRHQPRLRQHRLRRQR